MKRFLSFLLFAALWVPVGCVKDPLDPEEEQLPTNVRYYANLFAFNVMKTYYLWEAEMSQGFESWTYGEDPVKKVESLRYKDASGNTVDKWTRLMEDCSSFLGSITGNNKSFGFDFVLYYVDESKKNVCAVITFVYAGSPAEKAGLKRGDAILTLDGLEMTPDNYSSLVNGKIYGGDQVKFGLSGNRSVTLSSMQFYENPVQTVVTLNQGGVKMGYLHFSSFTMDACRDLEQAFRKFKEDGIEELVLDLRYNGGGYTLTSTVLASMLAPVSEVKAGSIFNKDVYNKQLTEYYKEEERVSRFAEEFEIESSSGKGSYKVHPAQVNPGIRKLWVIVTGSTASASEGLICGLKPYMDVTLVGEKTYGKYCGGYLIQAENFFKSLSRQKTDQQVDCDDAAEKLAGWGLYVISSRYSDRDGVTLSMPDGIAADYEAQDRPTSGIPLGDPSEPMLARVLELSSGRVTKAPVPAGPALLPAPPVRRPGFGVLLH